MLSAEEGLLIRNQYRECKEMIGSIRTIGGATMGVYLGLSFVLAILLLLNLFTMLVSEKKKELITLMINGFTVKQAEEYISFDTAFLTFIGIVLGTALGIDETVAYFSANGFKPLTGVIAAAHTRITILLWEAVNTMICVMQHVED